MKILSIYFKNTKGGLTFRLGMLLKELAKQHEVKLIASESLGLSSCRINEVIISPWFNEKKALFWLFFILRSMTRAFLLRFRRDIDMIVTFGPFYTLFCAPVILFYKLPSVTFIRGDNMKHSTSGLRNAFFYIVDYLGLKLSKSIVVVSIPMKEEYSRRYRLAEGKIKVLSNNIIMRKLNNNIEPRPGIAKQKKTNEFVISSVGIFNEGKNFTYLIMALALMTHKECRLIIIGDETKKNGYKSIIVSLIAELDLDDRVTLLGWLDNPVTVVKESDVFVCPSKFEGSPNALLEALGCEIPCLGSDIPEIQEVLHHDDLLFPLNDASSLAFILDKAISDNDFYSHIKKLSEDRVKVFSFDWADKAHKIIMSESVKKKF